MLRGLMSHKSARELAFMTTPNRCASSVHSRQHKAASGSIFPCVIDILLTDRGAASSGFLAGDGSPQIPGCWKLVARWIGF